MNVLVLAAHPDDEALGCGGTINKFSKAGADVRVITFTDGISARLGQGHQNKDRRSDLKISSKILGFSILDNFDFPDNKMDSIPLLTINQAIEKTLETNAYIPDIILVHNPWCLNIDHQKVFESAQTISRLISCKLMCFETPSSSEWNFISEFRGNCYVKLGQSEVDAKLLALEKAYYDEMRDPPHPRSYENVKRQMSSNGSVINENFAEKFMIIKEIL